MKIALNFLRPFIGAKNYAVSRAFYRDMGFEETVISNNLSLFQTDKLGFYLQDYFSKEWVENTMLFLEVNDVMKVFEDIKALELNKKYSGVEIRSMKKEPWGNVFYIIDPAGILLHVAQFTTETT